MKLFAISDLHLSFGVDKPMDVFYGWENYTEQLRANWTRCVSDEDTVVICGDISWSTTFEQARPDFEFINSLPGKKIILKGNHDFWWSTAAKINQFLKENNFDTISILYNNSYTDGKFSLCGSRGWLYDGSGAQDTKIISRECGRIELSLSSIKDDDTEKILFLHYPPVYSDFVCEEIVDVIKKHNIKNVYYGHIHGKGLNKAIGEHDGVKMHLVSCDCVDFTPVFIAFCDTFE